MKKTLRFALFICLLLLMCAVYADKPVEHYFVKKIQPAHVAHHRKTWSQSKQIEGGQHYAIALSDGLFLKSVNVDDVQLNGPIDLSGSIFKATTRLSHSHFKGGLFASLVCFAKPFFVVDCVIDKAMIFYSVHFLGVTKFLRNQFNGVNHFFQVRFDEKVDFRYSNFNSKVSFSKAVFLKQANFSQVKFNQATSFAYSTFHQQALFSNAVFDGKLTDFSHVVFHQGATFSGATIGGRLNFADVQTPSRLIDLTRVTPLYHGHRILINLVGADISHILINYTEFKLYFPPQTTQIERKRTYTQLLGVFKKEGLTESYKRLYVEYKDYQYNLKHRYLIKQVDKHWWYYGLEKGRLYFWILYLLLFFTIINFFILDYLVTLFHDVNFVKSIDFEWTKQLNFIGRFFYLLPFAFVLTLYICFGGVLFISYDPKSFRGKNILASVYLLSMLVFGVASALFIVEHLISGSL